MSVSVSTDEKAGGVVRKRYRMEATKGEFPLVGENSSTDVAAFLSATMRFLADVLDSATTAQQVHHSFLRRLASCGRNVMEEELFSRKASSCPCYGGLGGLCWLSLCLSAVALPMGPSPARTAHWTRPAACCSARALPTTGSASACSSAFPMPSTTTTHFFSRSNSLKRLPYAYPTSGVYCVGLTKPCLLHIRYYIIRLQSSNAGAVECLD